MIDRLVPPIDGLNRDELRHLLRKCAPFVDARDVASARWEAAQEDYSRLIKLAENAEDHAADLNIQCCTVKRNGKLLAQREDARQSAYKARALAERAYRRQERRWKEYAKHFMGDVT